MSQARPHNADPRMKTPAPMRKMGLRPNMSDNLPYTGTVVVAVSRKAATTSG
jgi:hypothetical protein